MVDIRRHNMFSKLTLFYNDNPLCLVRGEGQFVFDEAGRRYLDCVNNVAHVGHAHPRLVEAAMRQLGDINTNTRYLHPGRSRYAKKILSLFSPDCRFDCVFFVNSGSEANDLALQLARAYTRQHDVIVLDSAYHGHTSTMIDMSPYKHHQVPRQLPPGQTPQPHTGTPPEEDGACLVDRSRSGPSEGGQICLSACVVGRSVVGVSGEEPGVPQEQPPRRALLGPPVRARGALPRLLPRHPHRPGRRPEVWRECEVS